MANPNPQHNPTDGLAVAVYVHAAGTGVVANQTVASGRPNPGNYALTLSLSASGGHAATCTVTASLVDVANTAYTPVAAFAFKSYNPNQATVTSPAGVITAVAVGQAIVEIQFPTFDSTNSVLLGMEYTQIVVTVIP